MFLTETSCFYGSFWDTQFSIPSVSTSNHLKFLNPLPISADISANLSLCEINNHEAKLETEMEMKMEISPVLDGITVVVGQHVLFPSPIYQSCVGSDCSDSGCVVVWVVSGLYEMTVCGLCWVNEKVDTVKETNILFE